MEPKLLEEDTLHIGKKHFVIEFSDIRQVLGTSALNGGYREDLRYVFNFDEKGKDGQCLMKAATYEEHLHVVAETLKLPPAEGTGLSTAVQMKNMAHSHLEYHGVGVTSLITAGLDKNAGRAGDPAPWNGGIPECPAHIPGTVNIFCMVDAHLSHGAMAQAAITCTEAKTAAVQELVIPSNYSAGLATGSGTDGVIIIANPRSGTYLTDAGKHGKLGEMIGRTVIAAVKKALFRQTSLCAGSQHNILRRMERFGVTADTLCKMIEILSPGGTVSIEKVEDVVEAISQKDGIVAYASLYAHLLDELSWGLFEYDEADKAARKLLSLMGFETEHRKADKCNIADRFAYGLADRIYRDYIS